MSAIKKINEYDDCADVCRGEKLMIEKEKCRCLCSMKMWKDWSEEYYKNEEKRYNLLKTMNEKEYVQGLVDMYKRDAQK